ncbi:MAG: purine-nucleoside phosphorylase [Verrucomicrobiota bacterium]|nr:purine-nucleoside phosphorylase [Verrucomicrobiota bacterium]
MTGQSALDQLRDFQTDSAIILGSGLSAIVEKPSASIPYADFPEIPKPSVPGHKGKLSLCEFGGQRLICAQGRAHLYEGRTAHEVTAIVRVLAEAGVKKLIVTNAAGALNEKFHPGDWMMITDQLNLTGASPLIGNFLDMSAAYSRALQKIFRAAAKSIDLELREGVYAALLGPQYETPAEVRMLQKLGADAIGMSTVLEVIQARALGLAVAGFSCITNLAAGLGDENLSHHDVLATGRAAAESFRKLLAQALAR